MITESSGHKHLPITFILSTCLFLIGISAAGITPYRAIVAIDNLGMSNSLYALVMTLGSIGTALASLVMGNLADKLSDRRLLVMMSALMGALAYGLIYLIPTQFVYILSICVILPFGGALFSQTFSFSRVYYNHHQPERAEFMVSFLRTLFSVAWVVIPPIAGWVASRYSVYNVFASAAVAHLLFTLFFGLLLREPSTKIGTASQKTEQDGGKVHLPVFRLIGIVGVLFVRVAILLHLTVIPLALINDFGGTLATVGLNASIAAGLEIPFMLLWGWAASRLTKESILSVNASLFALYLFLLFNAHSVREVLWLQGLNAIATAALLSITISYMQESIKGRVGLSTSLMDVLTVVASLISATVFAAISDEQNYIRVFFAASLISFAGAAIIYLSRSLKPEKAT
ncbi:MAG: MFS transporter [Deinococcales bacterium]